MAVLLATVAAGQTYQLPVGTGHVEVAHDDCTIVGRPGAFPTYLQAMTAGRGPIVGTKVKGVTFDTGGSGSILAVLTTHPETLADLVLDDVTIRNVTWAGTAIANGGRLTARGLTIEGEGGHIGVALTSTLTHLRGVTCLGGRFGLQVADGSYAGVVPGVDVDGLSVDLMCSQSTRYETATDASAVTAGGISCTHVLGHRSPNDLVRVLVPVCPFDPERTLRSALTVAGDRLETSNAWTRITGIGPSGERLLDPWRAHGSMRHVDPEGEATVYRCFYGGVYGYASGSITLRNGWRTAAGEAMAVPQLVDGHRVDIVRHGITGGPRDYDTGCVHVTKTALNPVLRNVTATDGGSDLFSGRAVGGRYLNCNARTGRDYVFTFTAHHGSQYVENCQAESGGVGGFYLGGGASKLVNCRADRNGWNGGGYGFAVDPTPGADDATGSSISGDGSGNHTALCNLDEFVTRPVRKATRAPARRWRQWR